MNEYNEIKRKAGEYLGLPGFQLRQTITYLIDIIEKKDEALQLIDMMGDGEVCSFIRNFKEAKKVIEKMRTTATEALKLTKE